MEQKTTSEKDMKMSKNFVNTLEVAELYIHTCSFLPSLKQIGTICFAVFSLFLSVNFAIAGDTECGVKCDSSNDGKIMTYYGSDGCKSYKCSSGAWTKETKVSAGSCNDSELPSKDGELAFQSYWNFSEKNQAYFQTNKNYISGSSPQAAYVEDLCVACEVGLVWDSDKCIKASPYQPACYADSSEGDNCTVNKNATIAKCQSLGSKSKDKNVLTCTAWECNTGYLLRLRTNGKSLGRCDDEKTVCDGKCSNCAADEECLPELLKTPRTNKENGAYKLDTCQCRKKAGAAVDNSVCKTPRGDLEFAHSFKNLSVEDCKDITKTETQENLVKSWEMVCRKDAIIVCKPYTCIDGYTADFEKGKCIESEKPDTKPQEKPVNPQVENAKKVLSNFFANASANRNVWKNEQGQFNTARLASDMTAGVVLGTVGGVVSGVVIKKKQVQKGFEALKCYVGGKEMAGWGDTFNVDLLR